MQNFVNLEVRYIRIEAMSVSEGCVKGLGIPTSMAG